MGSRSREFGKRFVRAIPILMVIVPLVAMAGCLAPRGTSVQPPDGQNQSSCGPPVNPGTVKTWMYQLQELDRPGAVSALAAGDYDLLVVEPGHNLRDDPYPTPSMVSALRRKPDGQTRILLAYIDIGEAEDYRTYWRSSWSPPSRKERGNPDFLITVDPDGWSGNYPVAYWREEWKSIWLGPSGIVADLVRMGFDGVYLDWVEAYDDDAVRLAAAEDGVDPEEEMIAFIEEIGRTGRALCAGFLVVPQNAPYLVESDPERYLAAIDALAVEDTWFHGDGDAEWNDPRAGDLRQRHREEWSTPDRLKIYRRYQDHGLPVFSVDYCLRRENAAYVYRRARGAGLISLVTRVSLSRMTETPPWEFP